MQVLACPSCKYVGTKPAPFCPECGAAWPATEPASPSVVPGSWRELPLATPTRRIGAYGIDLLVVAFIEVFQVPGIGEVLGILGALYMLLRDMNGASLGKLVFGLRVARGDGSEASTTSRIVRNLPLSLADLPILIPIPGIDILITSLTVGLVSLAEYVLLFTTRRRLGDRMAGTVVLEKSVTRAAQAVTQ